MPTDLTTAEKAERLGLTKCNCCGLWRSRSGAAVIDVGAYAERFPAPDYRAALEGLVLAIDRGDGDAYRLALTHARKVLHGQ